MTVKPESNALPDVYDPVSSPYGPHPNGVDEAAGGADSSPLDNEPTGERQDRATQEKEMNRSGASMPQAPTPDDQPA